MYPLELPVCKKLNERKDEDDNEANLTRTDKSLKERPVSEEDNKVSIRNRRKAA